MVKQKLHSWQIVSLCLLLVLALLSVVFVSPHVSSPDFFPQTLETLDGQKLQAMTLSVVVTAASTALSTLPDDTGSAVAEEMADLATPLFLIVCLLYVEKFLLTTFGWAATALLFPGACVMLMGYILSRREKLFSWARKLLVLTLALLLIIPVSAKVTRMIQDTFSEQVSHVFDAASQLTQEEESSEEENGFLAFFSGLKDDVAALVETAKNMLSTLIDAVAVLLITSCVIPLLTALAFIWVVRKTMNVDIPVGKLVLLVKPLTRPRGKRLQPPAKSAN